MIDGVLSKTKYFQNNIEYININIVNNIIKYRNQVTIYRRCSVRGYKREFAINSIKR